MLSGLGHLDQFLECFSVFSHPPLPLIIITLLLSLLLSLLMRLILSLLLLMRLNILVYYINTSEIPSELSRENFISSHVKITCYLHM